MDKRRVTLVVAATAALSGLAACERAPDATPAVVASAAATMGVTAAPEAAATAPEASTHAATIPVPYPALPLVTVHKSASCGCCVLWIEHMQAAGFSIEVENTDNLEPVKSRLGVPAGKGSCHTAEVGGYVVEGHVPAGDIKRLLAKRPSGKGLVLPGMPMGSPGMETPDGRTQPYTVELVQADGSTVPFAVH